MPIPINPLNNLPPPPSTDQVVDSRQFRDWFYQVFSSTNANLGQLGTMALQNANNVAITGGTINALTVTSMGTNSYGTRTISTSAPSGGSNGDIWYQV